MGQGLGWLHRKTGPWIALKPTCRSEDFLSPATVPRIAWVFTVRIRRGERLDFGELPELDYEVTHSMCTTRSSNSIKLRGQQDGTYAENYIK